MRKILPLPISSNVAYPTDWKTGRRHLSKEGKQWIDDALWSLKGVIPYTEPVEIWINLYFPDNRVRDHWNYTKLPIDCLKKAGIIEDDKWQINPDAHLHAELDRNNPRLELIVEQANI